MCYDFGVALFLFRLKEVVKNFPKWWKVTKSSGRENLACASLMEANKGFTCQILQMVYLFSLKENI